MTLQKCPGTLMHDICFITNEFGIHGQLAERLMQNAKTPENAGLRVWRPAFCIPRSLQCINDSTSYVSILWESRLNHIGRKRVELCRFAVKRRYRPSVHILRFWKVVILKLAPHIHFRRRFFNTVGWQVMIFVDFVFQKKRVNYSVITLYLSQLCITF